MANAKTLGPDDYPNTLSIDEKDLPDVKNFKVGQTCTLEIKARVHSVSDGDLYGTGNKRKRATLVIESVKYDDSDDPGVKGFDSVKVDKRTKGS